MRIFLIVMSLIGFAPVFSQTPDVQRVEPPFWWVGMKNKELQVLVYGKNIASSTPTFEYPGVTLASVDKVENPNYLFLNLSVSPDTKPGKFPITFTTGRKKKVVQYELKSRIANSAERKGFNSSDVVYLITPDRFSNGDPSNDNIAGMKEKANRSEDFGRHGGDLKGIINHIPYLSDLGVTALWISPVTENDQPASSYHGYAITDYYKVDPRFGTNDQYAEMVRLSHEKNLKVIIDLVFNHCGSEHWFAKDPPEKDWIHQWPEFTRSNYKIPAAVDPYASEYDKKKMFQGWFDVTMPDLNQHNKRLLTYMTQNSIWWVEFANLDGIRMDTHPYNYKDAMAEWVQAVMTEYPNFNIVGEVLEHHVLYESYWLRNSKNQDGYQGHLPSTLDVSLKNALNMAFNEPNGWESGVARIYYSLTEDMVFNDPVNDLFTFLDNHDLTRFATSVGGDVNKMKMGITTLLTTRGIPQYYYGTEIMITGPESNHGKLRADFPGGWADDAVSVKDRKGLTEKQLQTLDLTKTLLNWRKGKEVIHTGKLMHFVPEDGIYVYFRYNDRESVMVILNNNDQVKTLDTKRFNERLSGFSSATDVINNKRITNLQTLELAPRSATVLDLQK